MKYKLNDNELISMVREHDVSYDLIFDKYKGVIFNIAKEFYDLFSDYCYELDDFIQEAYIGFYRALEFYNEKRDCTFYTFVVVCVKRNLSSFCKKITCESKCLNTKFIVPLDEYDIRDKRGDVISSVYSNYIDDVIKNIIYSSDIKYSSTLELKINGFSLKDISSLLDISISTVEYRLKVMRKRLLVDLNK